MKYEAEKYLKEIEGKLSNLPARDREDIVLEIQNHLYEATEKGEDAAQVISRLGSPAKLAQAYSLGYSAEHRILTVSDVLHNVSFYVLAGLSGIAVMCLFGFLAVVFLVVAVMIPGISLTNLLGLSHIAMFVWGDASIAPGIVQIVLSCLVGAVFAWLAHLCWKGIKEHIKNISADYRKRKLGE